MAHAIAARLLLVAAVVVGAACGDGGLDYDGEPGQPTPASFDFWVPVIDVTAGEVTGEVVVDTGAPFTVLDRDVYALNDGTANVELDAFGLRFPSYPVISYDVFDQSIGGHAGLLGGDLLSHFALSIDYHGERVWLRDGGASELPNGVASTAVEPAVEVPFDLRGGGRALVPGDCPGGCGTVSIDRTRVLAQVWLEDRADPEWFLVDTGASATVLPEATVTELGDPNRPRLNGVSVATVNGIVSAYFTRVASVQLVAGDGVVAAQSSQPVLVIPGWDLFDAIEAETGVHVRGLIGGSFLRHFLATVDYSQRVLRLARFTDQSHVDPDEFVRVGFTLSNTSGQWLVGDVYTGTDAAAAGLTSGDLVVEIDGVDITGLDELAVGELFARFGLGDSVPVGIDVAGEVQIVDVIVEDLLPAYE